MNTYEKNKSLDRAMDKGFHNIINLMILGRFELPTFRLGGGRSIQLSYRVI